jgi:hypothetical protein
MIFLSIMVRKIKLPGKKITSSCLIFVGSGLLICSLVGLKSLGLLGLGILAFIGLGGMKIRNSKNQNRESILND